MRVLASVLSLFATTALAQSATNAKADSDYLMNAALPFAKQMLQKHREFFPYGQALTPKGEVVAVATYDGREHPPSADIIRLLKSSFAEGARMGKYKATALVYDVRIQLPSTGAKSDAIAVSLNHKDNYSAVVYFAYTVQGSQLVMGEIFSRQGESDVFAR